MPATATARPGASLRARPISDLLSADTPPPRIEAIRRCKRCECILSIYADADAVTCWACEEIEAGHRPTASGQTKWAGPGKARRTRAVPCPVVRISTTALKLAYRRDRARDLYLDGLTLHQVAASLGVGHATVAQDLVVTGTARRGRPPASRLALPELAPGDEVAARWRAYREPHEIRG
jgi:hypothetical protein